MEADAKRKMSKEAISPDHPDFNKIFEESEDSSAAREEERR